MDESARHVSNPFQAPKATITVVPLAEVADSESVRRANIQLESAVRSIGTLGYFAAALIGSFALYDLVPTLGQLVSDGRLSLGSRLFETLILDLVAVVCFALPSAMVGRGLRRLRPWARWVALVAAAGSFLLLANKAAMGIFLPFEFFYGQAVAYVGDALWIFILGSIVLALIRPASSSIFKSEYREVIRQTPAIRCPTSLFAWGVMLYTLVCIAAIAGRIFYAKSKLGR